MRPFCLESDEKGNHTTPILPGGLQQKVNVRGVGLTRWADLAAILEDCEQSQVLSDIERALARNALTWLAGVGMVQ